MSLISRLKSLCPSSDTPVVLELDLSRAVLSSPPDNPLAALQVINAPSMRAIREGLRRAATDDHVKGLIVHIGTAQFSAAQGDELAALIRRFGEAKPTVAWTESFGEFASAVFAYKLAAAASQVWVQESGVLAIGGLHLDITLLKGLLNKAGIEPQFGQRKEFKSAADRFAADHVSEANREMMTRIGQSLVEDAVASIAADRDLAVEAVWEAVNAGQLTSDEAVTRGFIDSVGYRDEVYAAALAEWDAEPENLVFVHRYAEIDRFAALVPNPKKPAFAVVDVRGSIVTGRGQQGPLSGRQAASDVVTEHLRAAARDEQVKGVLLRVDSPGGSYIASDAIRREVLQVKASGRPVVAVMGDVAASGGYFVSMPATEIVAAPSTLTGSIGVLAGKMVTAGLYEKLGLVREGIDIGARAGMLAPGRLFTEDDWAMLNAELDRIYADFTAKAASDRGMPLESLEPLARGRVWTGTDAAERGLVDHLGGVDLALDRLADLTGVPRDEARIKPIGTLGLLERFRPARSSETLSSAGVGMGMPASPDEWLTAAASVLGISVPGVLSLPVVPEVRG